MNRRIAALALAVIAALATPGAAQTDTTFTYQGRLDFQGQPYTGDADYRFTLWDAAAGGNQIGAERALDGADVETGLFAAPIDFGAEAFAAPRWLQISVRTPAWDGQGDEPPYTTLEPRQAVTRAPYATQTRGIFVDELERVGIGTTDPQSFTTATIRGRGANSDIIQFQARTGFPLWHLSLTGAGLDFVETGEAANRLYLQRGGNVGIGTNDPLARLHVDGDIRLADGADMFGLDRLVGFDELHLFGRDNGSNQGDFTILPGGQSGVRRAFPGVAFNVQGRAPELSLLRVEQSNGDPVFRVDANRNVIVNGNFFVEHGTKNFVVDHPLDPVNKSLAHNAVEGPDYYTFYQGSVVLNGAGEAWAVLPDYFQALNTRSQYQLTCVGGYAPVYVAEEVRDNRFKIAGGREGLKVSWQVTAVRDDPYARDHPYRDVIEKQGAERGRYHYPAGYGAPTEMGVRDGSNDEPPTLGREGVRR